MSMKEHLSYKVWAPGQSPDANNPLLTLHNAASVRFFVEALLHESSQLTGKPFIMLAYLDELGQQVAEGTYRLQMEDGYPRLRTAYECGMLADYGGCQVTSAAILDAIAEIFKENEQVL